MHSHQPDIVILGAGVVGLSTALCIQEAIPRAKLTLFAEKFNEDTLSNGAGGLFRPEINIAPTPELGLSWSEDSYNHYMAIVNSQQSNEIGCQLVSGFHVSSNSQEEINNPTLRSILPNFRQLEKSELCIFPPDFKYGYFYTTIITDCCKYLPWMKKQFQAKSGKVEYRHVDNLNEFQGTCDLLLNCTGLGAKKLVSDVKLTPIRGQTIKVEAPWIKHFFFGNENYIIPGQETVTLGGIKTYGSSNLAVSQHDNTFIWEGCTHLVPSLHNSRVVGHWVGLRPYRQPVRVEAEIIKGMKVVHNYGHGGHGVTFSWGTAKHATHIAEELLKGYPASSL